MKWKLRYSSGEVAHTGNMADTIRIGQTLKNLLRSKGLSLKQVSVQTGIPNSTLHTWLENRQPKDILKVKRLADFLGVSLHELLFGVKELAPLGELRLPAREDLVGEYEVVIRRRGDS